MHFILKLQKSLKSKSYDYRIWGSIFESSQDYPKIILSSLNFFISLS